MAGVMGGRRACVGLVSAAACHLIDLAILVEVPLQVREADRVGSGGGRGGGLRQREASGAGALALSNTRRGADRRVV